jgi:hypothetical protein
MPFGLAVRADRASARRAAPLGYHLLGHSGMIAAMTQTASPAIGAACKCGCGSEVSPGRSWIRGHSGRGQGGYDPRKHGGPAIPGPEQAAALSDAEWEALEGGGPVWADPGPEQAGEGLPRIGPVEDVPAGPEGLTGDLSDDPPAHARDDWGAELRREPGTVKVTAAVRRDIAAKLGIPALVIGTVWEARDPYCGGRFNGQRKATCEAFADIMCDSPFWLDFMTGPMGGYVKWVKVVTALAPVAGAVIAHHVTHTVITEPEPDAMGRRPMPEPDPARYPG